jgi:hypothetical protein
VTHKEQVVDDRDDVDGLTLETLGARARRLDLGPWRRRRKLRPLECAAAQPHRRGGGAREERGEAQ